MIETKVKELIEKKDIDSVMIQYCKDEELLPYVLYDLNYSDKYGKRYVQAYCNQYRDQLFTFKIDRIKDIKPIWVKAKSNDVVSISGIYVFACAGDNHILFEIHRLEKGEKLWKYFEGEFEHCNDWVEVSPVAYYYLPEYEPNSSEWESCSLTEMDPEYLKVIAYSNDGNIGYMLLESDCVIGCYDKNLTEGISENDFLSENTFPMY